ncbi:ATP-binding protein [Crenobacter sp. SG2303]|uniref:ATP-binding protein n=1 Tax=Crenobacter oryzisoli TaxID=3056844 RepID=A0ABT7XQI2_9NEIS|nr:ATP-binding protein [Crenobacter sp. SG2303]MDN0076062.1 ATP-binding protein [Crenobacter sp. SG2303]
MAKHSATQRVAIVGPESSGKSTLAAALQLALADRGVAVARVDEYAREYYASRPYRPTMADIEAIAQEQRRREDAMAASCELLLCDSTALTNRIWAEVAFGTASAVLLALSRPRDYALTLLAKPDIAWQPDPLRSHPAQRDWLFDLYKAALERDGVAPLIVAGDRPVRLTSALAAIEALLKK